MIPQKIQALFNFIDYLDNNKREYLEIIPLCNELKDLCDQRFKLNPDRNYIDKQQHDIIQAQIDEKFPFIMSNIYTPITEKLRELEIWSGDNTYSTIWNNNISSIYDFKSNFKSEDVNRVIQYKKKYLCFRTETNTDFLCLSSVFRELDELFKELFDFFKDTNINEFENFETKTIKVNSIGEALNDFKSNMGRNVKYSLPVETLFNRSNNLEKMTSSTNINNEVIIGDKIQVGNISNNKGQISLGKENTFKNNSADDLTRKSFHWQKWGIIITIALTIITIVIMILIS
jgi:hypothetical protein